MNILIKRITCALLCIIIALCLVGCQQNPMNSSYDDEIFTIVESGNTYQILRHKETGVLYLFVYNYYQAGITVMMNTDGSPIVMEQEG